MPTFWCKDAFIQPFCMYINIDMPSACFLIFPPSLKWSLVWEIHLYFSTISIVLPNISTMRYQIHCSGGILLGDVCHKLTFCWSTGFRKLDNFPTEVREIIMQEVVIKWFWGTRCLENSWWSRQSEIPCHSFHRESFSCDLRNSQSWKLSPLRAICKVRFLQKNYKRKSNLKR